MPPLFWSRKKTTSARAYERFGHLLNGYEAFARIGNVQKIIQERQQQWIEETECWPARHRWHQTNSILLVTIASLLTTTTTVINSNYHSFVGLATAGEQSPSLQVTDKLFLTWPNHEDLQSTWMNDHLQWRGWFVFALHLRKFDGATRAIWVQVPLFGTR